VSLSKLLGAAALAFAAPALAQAPAAQPAADFVAPRIKDTWLAQLGEQPDITGVWLFTTGPGQTERRTTARLMFDPPNAQLAPGDSEGPAAGPPPGSRQLGIPYKPEYQAKYDEIVRNTAEGRSIDPIGACNPYGMPRFMGGQPGPITIMQSPTAIVMISAWFAEPRAIYLDGRAPPPPENELGGDTRTYSGHSVGRWEGDTLVVRTTNILEGYYDQTDPPFSDQIEVTERIRLVTPTRLEDRMTIVDPVMLTRPWEVTRYYEKRPGTPFQTFADGKCEPQDMSQGFQAPLLPQEREAARKAAGQDK
jgi:hypothetical protein